MLVLVPWSKILGQFMVAWISSPELGILYAIPPFCFVFFFFLFVSFFTFRICHFLVNDGLDLLVLRFCWLYKQLGGQRVWEGRAVEEGSVEGSQVCKYGRWRFLTCTLPYVKKLKKAHFHEISNSLWRLQSKSAKWKKIYYSTSINFCLLLPS